MSETKKKVLQSCLSRSWGGLEMVAYENALALAKNHFDVYTLCIEDSPLEKHLKTRGLKTFCLPIRRGIFDFLKIRRFIQNHQIQMIHVQLLKDLRLLSMALIGLNDVKVFGISHTFVNVNKKDFLHRWSYKKIHKLIALTELQKQNLLLHLPVQEHQLVVIPNYVDCERFSPRHRSLDIRRSLGGADHKFLVGVTSRLDPQKGQNFALLAMALLKRKKVPVSLVIVGENTLHETNYLAVLKKMAQDLDLEDCVHFAGYRADMEKVVASIDALLMPSKFETFGRVLIEAMASKTPVIATKAGGVPNIIQDHQDGLLVSPENAEEMAAAMEKLTTDPSLSRALSEKAYLKVKATYSQEVVESRLLKTFIEDSF